MWNFLTGPANTLLSTGLDAFMKSRERKNLQLAVRDRILREVRFNKTILGEILDTPKMPVARRVALAGALRTQAFDDLDAGILPLKVFFDELIDPATWPGSFSRKKSYLRNLASTETTADLVERLYHRIRIVKATAELGTVFDTGYIVFMLIGMETACRETER